MVINFQVSENSLTEDFVARCYEVAIDGTESEVAHIDIPFPHTSVFTGSFTGLDKISHTVKIIGVTSTIIFSNYDRLPTNDIVNLFDIIRFRIGDGGSLTPVAGSSSYFNPIMAGASANEYVVTLNGVGVLFDGLQISNNVLGGFDLAADTFATNSLWTIQRTPQVVRTVVHDSVVGKQFGPTIGASDMFVDVTSATNYNPFHLRKLIRLNGSAAIYTFTSGVVPPVGYVFRVSNFSTAGTTSPLPKVVFANATCIYGGGSPGISEFSVAFRQVIEFSWDGARWNITSDPLTPGNAPVITKGYSFVGDVPGEIVVTISFANQGNTNYNFIPVVVSTGTLTLDNRVLCGLVGGSKTNTSVRVWLREINTGLQSVAIEWTIIN